MRRYDAIVVGLGAMGSAAARALARRGLQVLGLDAFRSPHTQGSSHGLARIIREAYFEHPAYVPLVQRAYLLWEELERESGKRLLLRTGGIMIGPAEGVVVQGALRSAEEHRLPHQMLDATEMRRRFPMFEPDASMVGVWEPRAGVLFPEEAIAAFLAAATRAGAELRMGEPTLSWRAGDRGCEVTTALGRYGADRLVLCAGAWMTRLAPRIAPRLEVERVAQFWFEPVARPDRFHWTRCPITIWEYDRERFFYSFPLLGPGVKIALHHQGRAVDIETVDRRVAPEEAETLRALMTRYLPNANGSLEATAACFYTNTPDGHFVIDRDPEYDRVLYVSACSGHGFKFCPAIGEIVSDLLVEGETRHDLSMFSLARTTMLTAPARQPE
jgi:sarcosine oxidase